MTTPAKTAPAKKTTKPTTPAKKTSTVKAPVAKTPVAKTPVAKVKPESKAPAADIKAVVEPINAAIKSNAETVTKIVEANTEVAKQSVEKTTEASQEQVATVAKAHQEQIATAAKVSADTFKGYEDIIAMSKDNIEAMVQSNDIYSKGIQQINETILKLVQDNVAQTVDYTQKIMTCTSIEDVVALQQEIASAQYNKTVEETKLLSEMTVKLAEKASKPISDRVNVTIETLTKPIAA